MNALRSIASAIALRICGLLNGAASRFTIRLRLMYCVRDLADRLGRLRLHVLEQRDGDVVVKVMSNSPATKARMRVDRLAMMRHSMASRYGRPFFQ